jgi:hypothetical protein
MTMSKRDLADVLVKLSGFGFITGAAFSVCLFLVGVIETLFINPHTLPALPYWEALHTPVLSILFGIILIRQSPRITAWLIGNHEA